MVRRRLAVVTPVLNDWTSLYRLIENLVTHLAGCASWLEVHAIDDGSTEPFDPQRVNPVTEGLALRVTVTRLALNLGHQRAIATGLVGLARRDDLDGVLVLDADGEDRPEDTPRLIAHADRHPGRVVMAQRARRSEGFAFRAGYACYKAAFTLMTGRAISFGNFSFLPMAAVRRLVHMPELWNNLPAAIIRSRIPYDTVPTERGRRYDGHSRMSYSALALHGFSAISVYTDLIFVRVLFAAGITSAILVLAIVLVIAIRFTTSMAIPGWATIVVGDILIILSLAIVLIIATGLTLLAARSARPLVPIVDAPVFVEEISITDYGAPAP